MNNKKTAGITLMELVVVLAIVAIIGAIVVPNFFGMTGIARLRADIQSTMVLDNAFQLYRLQNPGPLPTEIDDVLERLHEQNFLTTEMTATSTQDPDSRWTLYRGNIRLVIHADVFESHFSSLTQSEQDMVYNR